MSTIGRTVKNFLKVGPSSYFKQMNTIGDTKWGRLVGVDANGNKFFENNDEVSGNLDPYTYTSLKKSLLLANIQKMLATAYQYTQAIKQILKYLLMLIKSLERPVSVYSCLSIPTNDHQCLKMLVNACSILINVGKSLKNSAHVYQCLLLMNTALE
ncbi:Putative NADH ubiquinone oxidoreductase subunit NDUFA12 [Rhizopus microsporus]|nr:Putative NADH ubiquinone oxidoreductase subunit NDUFA12 [Rhizopus microsporus]